MALQQQNWVQSTFSPHRLKKQQLLEPLSTSFLPDFFWNDKTEAKAEMDCSKIGGVIDLGEAI